ncbi:translation initiation factor IF-3, partial [Dysosmobacter welbionis]
RLCTCSDPWATSGMSWRCGWGAWLCCPSGGCGTGWGLEAEHVKTPPAGVTRRGLVCCQSHAEAMTSLFFTKYSTPEYRVVRVMTHTQSVFTTGGMGRNISTTHTIVAAVLTLPDHPAAMTRPLSLAIIRRPLTANSRQMTMSSIQAGICPISTNHSMAAVTSILSARGS